MTRTLTGCLATGVALLLTGAALVAHHAESAQFDVNQPVEVTGIVKKVEWMNPHIWYYVDVKDEPTGKVVTWGFSGGPPGMLARRGFTKDTMKPGMVVTYGAPAPRMGRTTHRAVVSPSRMADRCFRTPLK